MIFRNGIDGAKLTKKQNMISTSGCFIDVGSLSHSNLTQLPLCHVIGDECAETIRNGFSETFGQLQELNGKVVEINVLDDDTKKNVFVKVLVVHVMDMKCLYIFLGHLGWSASGYFSAYCTCKKHQNDGHPCQLMTNEFYHECKQLATQKYAEMSESTYELWIRSDNYGIRHNGAMCVNIESLYVDTFHTKSNITVSFAMSFLRTLVQFEEADDESLSRGWVDICSGLGYDCYTIEDYAAMKRPGFLGNDCSSFRKAFFGKQDNTYWDVIDSIGDDIVKMNETEGEID